MYILSTWWWRLSSIVVALPNLLNSICDLATSCTDLFDKRSPGGTCSWSPYCSRWLCVAVESWIASLCDLMGMWVWIKVWSSFNWSSPCVGRSSIWVCVDRLVVCVRHHSIRRSQWVWVLHCSSFHNRLQGGVGSGDNQSCAKILWGYSRTRCVGVGSMEQLWQTVLDGVLLRNVSSWAAKWLYACPSCVLKLIAT